MKYHAGMNEVYVILHSVRSAHNVGSILRTADGVGVAKVYFTGVTPTPIDRFGRPRKDVAKVALGAEKTVAWEQRDSTEALIREFKERGVRVVAVEQDTRSVSYLSHVCVGSTAFLFGAEVDGVPPSLLSLCDAVVELPMYGKKESLNVAVVVGIVLYHARAQPMRSLAPID